MSLAQPALGALLAGGAFPAPRVIVLGLVAGTAGIFCVYAANDLLDRESDRAAAAKRSDLPDGGPVTLSLASTRRPLARGLLSDRLAAGWVGILAVVAISAAYALRPACALIFGLCVVLEVLYCSLKRRTWLKTIVAGIIIGLGGLAGWYAVKGFDLGSVAFFSLLVVWEIFGRNLANDLADLHEDAPLGLRTLATTHGPRWAARACLAGALLVVPIAAFQPASALTQALLVTAALWTMTLPAVRLAQDPRAVVAQLYFDRASLFPPLAFLAACVVVLLGGRV